MEFRFNSRSSGQDVPEAISIAKKLGGILKNRFYIIEFEDPKDKNLEKLSGLVGHLKGSAISIDGEEPINANKFFHAVHCPDKLLCKGICMHVGIGYSTLDSFLMENMRNIEDNVLVTTQDYLIRTLSNFLEMVDENRFKFNNEMYFMNFQRETEMEKSFCDKYDLGKIESEIMKLPNEIKLLSEEFLEEREGYKEEREYHAEDIVNLLLRNSEISSKLSVNDKLKCAKATCILLGGGVGVPIENSDLLIYYIPYIDKYILTKLKISDPIEMSLDDEESDEKELKLIIEKREEFFYLTHQNYELYYMLFDEDLNKLMEYFIDLKKI